MNNTLFLPNKFFVYEVIDVTKRPDIEQVSKKAASAYNYTLRIKSVKWHIKNPN